MRLVLILCRTDGIMVFKGSGKTAGGVIAKTFCNFLAGQRIVQQHACSYAHSFLQSKLSGCDACLCMKNPCKMFPCYMEPFRNQCNIQRPIQICRDDFLGGMCQFRLCGCPDFFFNCFTKCCKSIMNNFDDEEMEGRIL